MDIAKLKIDTSKMLANGDEYFGIYEKHIPRGLGKDKLVLVYEIQNLDCIIQIIGLNPEAGYIVVGNDASNQTLKFFIDKKTNVQYLNSLELEDCNMKFDCIIMNPPYSGNLHLKILAEAIQHLKDDKSAVVNLSPDNWLTNPFKAFDKEKAKTDAIEKLGCHIKEHESFTSDKFNKLFGTQNFFGVGIVVLGKEKTSFDWHKWDCQDKLLLKILSKVCKMPSLRSKYTKPKSKFFVPCRRRTHRYLTFCEQDDNKIKAKDGIDFTSEKERDNFKKSILDTWLYKYFDKSEWTDGENSAYAPFLGDVINPRTGLKGYQGEWTDDDLYKLFGISEDEQKIIEDMMKKYK